MASPPRCDLRTWNERRDRAPRPPPRPRPTPPNAIWRASIANGVDCGRDHYADRVAATRAALDTAAVVLQPTLPSPFNDRLDALTRTPEGWVATMVFTAKQFKPDQLPRFARALLPFAESLGPMRATLLYVDPDATRRDTPDEPASWFKSVDVTDAMAQHLPAAAAEAAKLSRFLESDTPPTVAMGAHCLDGPCAYVERCSGLPGATPPAEDPPELVTPEVIDQACKIFAAFPRPWAYFDIETVNPALPLRPGDTPYQVISAQWALIIDDGQSTTTHTFLADDLVGAEAAFVTSFLEATEGLATIFVWSPYERQQLSSLASRFPAFQAALNGRIGRLQDALKLVGRLRPGRKTGLKSVSQALVPDQPYSDLAIADGRVAGDLILVALDPAVPIDTREALRRDLIAYNVHDVKMMAAIVAVLCGGSPP